MKRTVFRYVLSGILVLTLTLGAMSGCMNNKDHDPILYDPEEMSGEDKKALTFFGYKADSMNLTAIEEAMQNFMEENKNIDITYEGIKGGEYWEAFDKRYATDTLDDIFMMHHDHVVSMGAKGKLADLSDIPGIENYSDEAKAQFINPDGTVYFLPTQVSTYNLYINYDVLKKYNMEVPENWQQFQEICDYFVSENIVPIIANNRNSLPTLIVSKGLFDVYQQPDVDSALKLFEEDTLLLVEALSSGVMQVGDMISRGWFDCEETLATEQTSEDLEIFLRGERPFMISGGWATVRVRADEPDFSYGIHPYPILEDGSVLPLQVDTCISVNADSPYLEEAKKFVEYMIRPDVMWNYCDSQASYMPMKNDDRVPSEKSLIPSLDYLSNGRVVFRSEYRLDLPMETALMECSRALLTGSTPKEALKILADELKNQG